MTTFAMNLTLQQARYMLEALGEVNLKHLMEVQSGKHSTETDDECSSEFSNVVRMKTLDVVIKFLDENTPEGLTLEGKPQAYPGQKFSGMVGPVRK